MRAALTHKRLERLAARIRPQGRREFTLEELCRNYWRLNKRGFLALVKQGVPGMHLFADIFEREDAERRLANKKGHP
jgi:hypothetical protein